MRKFQKSFYQKEHDILHVFFETRNKKKFVGTLRRLRDKFAFEFEYDPSYLRSQNSIPIGPDLSLKKQKHTSKDLFPTFHDRIPSKENPAYKEYCHSEGISVKEDDPIVLLSTIGKRGPSSFVFEAVWSLDAGALLNELERLKQYTKMSLRDLSTFLGVTPLTIQRLCRRETKDTGHLTKLLIIYFTFPEVAIWQAQLVSSMLHQSVFRKIINYFLENGNALPKNGKNTTRFDSSF